MAKGQKRSNREVKKPKAKKVPVATDTSSVMSKGISSPLNVPKKKK